MTNEYQTLQKIETIMKENMKLDFNLLFDTDEKKNKILMDVKKVLEELEKESSKSVSLNFDRWKCARCVAINITLGIAVASAVAAFGPASPGVVPYVMSVFGFRESVASAIVIIVKGGGSGAQIAKEICDDC